MTIKKTTVLQSKDNKTEELKYKKAIEILSAEMIRIGGEVFARYLAELNPVAKEHVEATEFFNGLLEGNLKLNDKDKKYLQPYLDKLSEIVVPINLLSKYKV